MSDVISPRLFGRTLRHVHLLGAGGMGMAPLGLYLVQRGFRVSAEDDSWNPATRELLGRANVELTAANGMPAKTELVVFSPAVGSAHPARAVATAKKIEQVRRGEMLAETTRDRKLVAVVGSHGKTTTTAMLITALRQAGFDCGWVLGGLFPDNTLPPACDAAEWVVAEVDESDGTIGLFAPEITLAVNIDWDHSDHYARPSDSEAEFAALFARTKQAVFMSDACVLSRTLIAESPPKAPVITFGVTGDFQCDHSHESAAEIELKLGGRFAISTARVRARGEFNAHNAVAALAVAQHLGAAINPDSLAGFVGVRRRQTVIHSSPGLTIYEDYAHHPAEIRALLAALRREAGRLVVVFQPHRFTRTAQFKAEFAAGLAIADQIFLLDVYAAGELPVAGGRTSDLVAALAKIGSGAKTSYLPGAAKKLGEALQADLQDGDTLAFVGAGDIEVAAHAFVATLSATKKAGAEWTSFIAAVRPRLTATAKFAENELLGPKTTMRVGGPARVYAEPTTEAELQVLLKTAQDYGRRVFMLGRGSNLLVPDEGVDGLVISLAHPNWQTFEPQADGRVWVGAGLRLKNLCGLATKAGLQGFEFMEGIPASVGGALRMNAGAMNGWTFDVVDEVHLMTLAGEKQIFKKAEMHVDYRHCAELETAVALGACLRPLAQGDAQVIKQQIETYQKKRQESQPREPSAGCIFKNPPGTSAGKVIDECGLKGTRVGDAEVSSVHANFIVNRGQATGADVLTLVRKIRVEVKSRCGINLEPEVMLFGQNWKDVL